MPPKKEDDLPDEITSWGDVADLIEHFSLHSTHDWLFRGVRDAGHGLIPKIGREGTRRSKPKRVPYRPKDERAVFEMFCQQARPYLPSAPQNALQWLAIAQHFGLPTRFLDWSDMFLAATWFAVEDGGGRQTDSAIWITRGVPQIGFAADDPFQILDICVYRPPHITARIAAQGSVLMLCPSPTFDISGLDMLPFLKKTVIKNKAQFEIKKRLNACGINRRQLFPDLGGLTSHLTWVYKNDWLAGYR